MPLKANVSFHTLPLDWKVVGDKKNQDLIIGSVISSYFYKHISDLYDRLLSKSITNSHRVAISDFFTTNRTLQKKVRLYKNEGSFLNFINDEFSKNFFFYNHLSCSNTDLRNCVNYHKKSFMLANKKHLKDVWVKVAKDVKENIPMAYSRFLELFLPVYIHCVSLKERDLCEDLWNVVPVVKSKERELLNLLRVTNLEDEGLRNVVLKKILKAQEKNPDLVEVKIYLKSKPPYEEFKDFLNLYKNFDKGFTDSLVQNQLDMLNLKIKMNSLAKTFPLLISDNNKAKRYNELIDLVLLTLYLKFDIEVYFSKKFGRKDVFGDVEEYSILMNRDTNIQGIPIIELLEEILLFAVTEVNENRLCLTEDAKEIINKIEIQTNDLILNLTIPEVENIQSKALKW